MDILKEKWDQILQTVKVEHELSDISFKTWLQPLQLHEITDTTVTILVPNEQMAIDYISKKYTFPLKVAIAECTGKEYNIEFILPEQAAAQLEAKKGRCCQQCGQQRSCRTRRPESEIYV